MPRARAAGGAAGGTLGGGRRLRHGASSYWFSWWSASAAPAAPATPATPAKPAATAGVASASVETSLVADLMAEAHEEVASIEIEPEADSTEIEAEIAATEIEAEVSSIEIDAEIQMQLEAEAVAAATTKALTEAPTSTEYPLMVWRPAPELAKVEAAAARCEVRGQGLAPAASRALALVAPSTLNLNP